VVSDAVNLIGNTTHVRLKALAIQCHWCGKQLSAIGAANNSAPGKRPALDMEAPSK
jgi:hypothetical protein